MMFWGYLGGRQSAYSQVGGIAGLVVKFCVQEARGFFWGFGLRGRASAWAALAKASRTCFSLLSAFRSGFWALGVLLR